MDGSSLGPTMQLLLGGTIGTILLFLAFDAHCRAVLKTSWKLLLVLGLVSLVWRFPVEGRFFHGLEYEDAYVYTVSARHLLANFKPDHLQGSPLLISVCAVGNPDACHVAETFSGHFIGYPYAISVASHILGYGPYIGNIVSLSATFFAFLMIVIACKLIHPTEYAATSGAILFVLTPVFAVYGVGSYAEPMSNALVVTVLVLFLRFSYTSGYSVTSVSVTLNWLAFTLSMILSVVTKRENILLVFLLPLVWLLDRALGLTGRRNAGKFRLGLFLLTTFITSVFVLFPMRLIETLVSETGEYGQFPFGVETFQVMFSVFIRSFATPAWYLGSGVFVLCAVFFFLRRNTLLIYPLGLLAAYLFLYAAHIRSYYQLNFGDVSPFDALRYSMNVAGLWSIVGGCSIATILKLMSVYFEKRHIRVLAKPILICVLAVFVTVSYVATSNVKHEMLADEFSARIAPALDALRFIGTIGVGKPYILTPEPLVVQMYARDSVNVLDFTLLDPQVLQQLAIADPGFSLLYLEEAHYLNPADRQRYFDQFSCVEQMEKTELYHRENYSLYLVKNPQCH